MHSSSDRSSRRKVLTMLGTGGALFAGTTTRSFAQAAGTQRSAGIKQFPSIAALKAARDLATAEFVQTAGYFTPGDGGGGTYHIQSASTDKSPNEGDVIGLSGGRIALLLAEEMVNYRMFGARGHHESDDGQAIKHAHLYANRMGVPVVNLSGEFWVRDTHGIPIRTDVSWGSTSFHIDERFNRTDVARFIIQNDSPTTMIPLTPEAKAALLEKLKPGVMLIPELAAYAGCLVSIADANDRIGIREGPYAKPGWAREELFYVEQEGRIIGEIAWQFSDFTSLTATPCNDGYLVIEGGRFYFSGAIPENAKPGYHHHGIEVARSRTIIREQWMGLEADHADRSLQPRRGCYVFNRVFDVTLENIRAIPWEHQRDDPAHTLKAGTYGISGARMLRCTFRNLIAEGGPIAWGVLGTNLNKDFRLENCQLNRVDVHFHCWNLTISHCTIGFKRITITGGGSLLIEHTECHANQMVNFRRDYGAKWAGDIRIVNCTLRPNSAAEVAVLHQHMADFDYQYPIGHGHTLQIENLVIDYGAAPRSTAACWLLHTVGFSKTKQGERLFFPDFIEVRNVRVVGRAQGVRLLKLPDPGSYKLPNKGGFDGDQLKANSHWSFEQVQLEAMTLDHPSDAGHAHLQIGDASPPHYADDHALFPQIRFSYCIALSVYLADSAASVSFEHCLINTVYAPNLQGALSFTDCRIQPMVKQARTPLWSVDSQLGTRFTNCTLHAPKIAGAVAPEALDQLGFIKVNQGLRHFHLNTSLGNELLRHFHDQKLVLTTEFISQLKAHHALES